MDFKLQNKVVVVTGSSKGIGAGIAKAFAKAGAKVVVNYATSKEGAEKVVNEITKDGGSVISVHADITKSTDVNRLFEETKKAYGQLDVLVNNAGVFSFELLKEITEDSFHTLINTHVLGNILATQKAVEMFGNQGGSIINISSTVSQNPVPGLVLYAAAKAAIDNITKTLSKELGSEKIRINTIAPGMTETEGTRSGGIIGSEIEKETVARTPLGRLGQPEDIATVAVFLASDEAKWITGERISVAGGLV